MGFADEAKDTEIEKFLLALKSEGNSIGGSVFLNISGCPVGIGDPVFDKLKAQLAKALMSIGSCMGINFGLGEKFNHLTGKEISQDPHNFSGIEGGISNGADIYLELVFKAPSTVGEKALNGRHDPCILPRVLPVVESMAKIVIADQFLKTKLFSNYSVKLFSSPSFFFFKTQFNKVISN